jgi:phosphoribosylformylglycinamidine synthase subunit PurSL
MNASDLYAESKIVSSVFEVNVSNASDTQLKEIAGELGLCLNLQEMKAIQAYFKIQRRNPTDVELQTLAQTWSEHCYHKTFKGKIALPNREIDSLFKTYIAKATREINPRWCFSVFEDNAGIVTFDKGYGIAAKVETHNHPSAVEPFGGAATGVGGVIRDVLGVWADPIACTDVLGFGPLDYPYDKLAAGVKHPKYVYMGVTAGIGAYGNNVGIPTVNGAIYFDESYTGNVTVYCGCIGLLPLKKFKKDAKPGHLILLAGGKTGRDGIHGVTFASAELTEKSEEISRPAVQIADPIEEEKLKRAIVEIRDCCLGSSVTDLGGGGLSSAVGETAKRFNCGAMVELEKVPLKYAGLSPWEIYISESQERMLLTLPPENLPEVLEVFEKEDVVANVVGQLTDENCLMLMYKGEIVAKLNMDFLFAAPPSIKTAIFEQTSYEEPVFSEPRDLSKTLRQILATPNITSKEGVIRTYDHEVKGNTVLKPLEGEYAGPNDASVLKPLEESWMGLAISCGMNPNYGKIDSYWMAASAIDEAIRNNIAVGGRRIALLDNFTWGNPEKPERLGSLVRACEACYDYATAFKAPFISGKDSLYNESPMGPVTPTLLITAIGIVPDIRSTISMDAKKPGDSIYVIGYTFDELGGSEYYKLMGHTGRRVPQVREKQAKKTFKSLTQAIDLGLIKASHDLSEGGLGVGAAEMALAGDLGLELDLAKVPRKGVLRDDHILFSESNSRFLVEIAGKAKSEFEALMKGKISTNLTIHGLKGANQISLSSPELRRCWKSTLSSGVGEK